MDIQLLLSACSRDDEIDLKLLCEKLFDEQDQKKICEHIKAT